MTKENKLAGSDSAMAEKTLAQTIKDVTRLLTDDWPKIFKTYTESSREAENAGFNFPIGTKITMTPANGDVKIVCKINYGVKYSDETSPALVSLHPDMFGNK